VGFIEFCADIGVLALSWQTTTLGAHDEVEVIASLQGLLRAAVNGPEGRHGVNLARPSEGFLAQIREQLQEVRWEPQLERRDRSVGLRHHAFIRSAQGVYALLAILLMDPKHRKIIQQCGFPACPHFFAISPEKTGRRGHYCNHHSDEDIDAMRKRRTRAAEKLSGRYPESAVDDAVRAAMREHPEVTQAEQLAKYAEAHLRHTRKRT
jgi:hypothetical protein